MIHEASWRGRAVHPQDPRRRVLMLAVMGLAALGPLPVQAQDAEARLVQAEGLAARFKFSEAVSVLSPLINDAANSPPIRTKAATAMLSAGLLAGRYDQAASAARALEAARVTEAEGGKAEASGAAFALALEGAPPPSAEIHDERIAARRDLAGLYRIEARVGMTSTEAVVDTGANFSVVSESTAKVAGLTLRAASVNVGSASDKVNASRLAIGDVTVGSSRWRNVVFIVMPDAALSFPMGYKITMILGMPQLAQLGSITFRPDALVLASRRGQEGAPINLASRDLSIFADVTVNGKPMRMMIDTGARRSFLSQEGAAKLGSDAPSALNTQKIYGAGGEKSVPTWTLERPAISIDGSAAPAGKLLVKAERGKSGADGTVGQDILSAKSGFMLDFERPRLALVDR